MTQALSRDEVLALPPVIGLPMLGKVLGLSEATVRERVRRGEVQAMGIRVVKLGAQWRVITADLLTVLGLVDVPDPPSRV